MNLGQFHARVKGAIKRGNSLDDVIPLWAAEAARLLEQNYTFSWMAKSSTVVFPAGNEPLSVALSPLVKAVDWVKPVMNEGQAGFEFYGPALVGVDQRRVIGISGGNPSGYWIEGENGAYTLNFDAIPQSQWTVKMKFWQYTDWPTEDAATPTLLLRGQVALFAQTLILFANEQRDERMAATYGGILQGGLNTLLRSEEDLKMSHQNDLKLGYAGVHG